MEAENNMLHLLNSTVTHEMLTPLKCMMSFSKSIMKEMKNSPKFKEAKLILTTSKLLLS